MDLDHAVPVDKRRRLERVAAACDLCKRRKVKCDGEHPCAYCRRKDLAETCTFSGSKPRGSGSGSVRSTENTPHNHVGSSNQGRETTVALVTRGRSDSESDSRAHQSTAKHADADNIGASLSPSASREDRPEDTVVPLEGRILRDAQGKVIFIGDCAPLSFLQTVRHLIASKVDADGFPAQTSRDSMIEVSQPNFVGQIDDTIDLNDVEWYVNEYTVVTSGLVDLFDNGTLLRDLRTWAIGKPNHDNDTAPAVYYLVLAIGAQDIVHETKAEAWFKHARELLLKNMCSSMNVSTVQGFSLVAIFMLRAFQPNGAYLYFSLAARTAYAIGLHRTEVNASFGPSIGSTRDRIWKSLRCVDMLISNLLGRPPSTSDVDCTVRYSIDENTSDTSPQILDASVQIFMVITRVVIEVYSRKRISLRIAGIISHQFKGWASTWLRKLSDMSAGLGCSRQTVIGACSTLCSYYYGIMLLTRPFLIYELYEYMGTSVKGGGTQKEHQEKRKYADAALDAAASLVDTLQAVISTGKMPTRLPLVVSWLFTTSLVLAVGVLGRSGLLFEENCRASIRCLDYFGSVDPHARQYSLIVQALLKTTAAHVKKRELIQRSQRKQASSQLFGLLPATTDTAIERSGPELHHQPAYTQPVLPSTDFEEATAPGTVSSEWTISDTDFFTVPWLNDNDQGLQGFLQPGTHTLNGSSVADIPLFPMYDQQIGGDMM